MKTLLAIEWLKIKSYRTFWILAGLFLLLLPLWNYEVSNGFIRLGGKSSINILSTAYAFPQVWGNLGFWGSVFVMFLSMLVIILTTNEYTFRTNRQNIIDGWTRMNFFHAKVLLVLIMCLAATLYLFILGMIFGGQKSGGLGEMFTDFQQVGYFFILSLDYLGFALFIAVWIRRSGLAIGLFLLYAMIIENIVKGVINHYADMPWGNFLFLQASDELLPFPLLSVAKNLIAGANDFSMTVYLSVTLLWCTAYYFGARAILQKSDW